MSLALFDDFVTCDSKGMPIKMDQHCVNLMSPVVFSFLMLVSMVPYWFSAVTTMKSIINVANDLVKEVANQWPEIPGLSDSAGLTFKNRREWYNHGKELVKPNYLGCIRTATKQSLQEMVAPGALVIFTPIIVGTSFGVGGGRGGAADSHSACALSAPRRRCQGVTQNLDRKDPTMLSNIMAGEMFVEINDTPSRRVIYAGMKSTAHAGAVVGDTVGDPLKDTSGPALNIVRR